MLITGLTITGIAILALTVIAMLFKKIGWKAGLFGFILGGFFTLSQGLFFYAEPGMVYFKQTVFGQQEGVTQSGIRWRGFATLTPWNQYLDVKTIPASEMDDEKYTEIEGKMSPIAIRFIDQVTAHAMISVRFKLPSDNDTFRDLAIRFRTQENLIQSTLVPTVKQVVSNTAYMFAAQDYISGSASDFRTSISDQMKNGEYSVEKKTIRDTVTESIKQDTTDRRIKEIKTSYVVEKREDAHGKFIRISHDVNKAGVSVDQAIIDDIQLETAFKDRLNAQRDESAKRQLEQQKIKTAKDAQQRIIAEGERDKAAERAAQEKLQVAELITKETELKSESTKRDLAKIALETTKLQAQAIKIDADAKSYKAAKMVKAGLTPEKKALIEKEIEIAKWENIAKLNLGTNNTFWNGGQGGNGKNQVGTLESILGAKLLQGAKVD
jgi:hypothetical protein